MALYTVHKINQITEHKKTRMNVLKKTIYSFFFAIIVLSNLLVCLNISASGIFPQVIQLLPNYGVSRCNEIVRFTTKVECEDSWKDIDKIMLILNTNSHGNRCFYGYYSLESNNLYLRDDLNYNWLGGYTVGSFKQIENSYCILDCSKTKIRKGEKDLIIEWAVTFKPSFKGTKNSYMIVKSKNDMSSGWVKTGSWTIDYLSPDGVVMINDGAEYTENLKVALNLYAYDEETKIKFMRFSNNGTDWTEPEPYNRNKEWLLEEGNGQKMVYVQYCDKVGNWSDFISDKITLNISST